MLSFGDRFFVRRVSLFVLWWFVIIIFLLEWIRSFLAFSIAMPYLFSIRILIGRFCERQNWSIWGRGSAIFFDTFSWGCWHLLRNSSISLILSLVVLLEGFHRLMKGRIILLCSSRGDIGITCCGYFWRQIRWFFFSSVR
jgi:hypothetical protein